jgi:hypothetical protein
MRRKYILNVIYFRNNQYPPGQRLRPHLVLEKNNQEILAS